MKCHWLICKEKLKLKWTNYCVFFAVCAAAADDDDDDDDANSNDIIFTMKDTKSMFLLQPY